MAAVEYRPGAPGFSEAPETVLTMTSSKRHWRIMTRTR